MDNSSSVMPSVLSQRNPDNQTLAEASDSPYLNWRDRPQELKERISSIFLDLSNEQNSYWKANGTHSSYGILTINEFRLIKAIIQNSAENQFYVLDIGAGRFGVGMNLVECINSDKDIRGDVTVHVISVRGEGGKSVQRRIGKCELYNLTAFKIENIIDEFIKRDLLLENKIHLIFSNRCFRHLNDPVGTFVQTYNLLRPITGTLLIDSFYFLDINQTTNELFTTCSFANVEMIDLFVRTGAPFLMQLHDLSGSDHFLLRRINDNPCRLNMTYLPNFETNGLQEKQIYSYCITRFDKREKQADLSYFKWRDAGRNCLYGEKRLFDWLRTNGLIDFSLRCGIAREDSIRFQLHQAIIDGDLEEVEKKLKAGIDINEVDLDGYTALHLAMKEKKMDCFQLLLERGADHTIPSCDNLFNEFGHPRMNGTPTLVEQAEIEGYGQEYVRILKELSK